VGSQDQILAACGGFNHIVFQPNGTFSVQPITLGPERMQELNSHLMLFYTGIQRTASAVAESYVNDIEGKRRQLRIMKDLIEESISILNKGEDIKGFGELLHESWQAKRSLSDQVSSPYVDALYDQAISAGAIGGKLTGAGGGGFLLLFVPPANQEKVKRVVNHLIHVPFKFEFSGSQIIFFDLEQGYSLEAKERAGQATSPFSESHLPVTLTGSYATRPGPL
jgi:D-glycero-alpha-D-manno-heptose-7-phosphate kinase